MVGISATFSPRPRQARTWARKSGIVRMTGMPPAMATKPHSRMDGARRRPLHLRDGRCLYTALPPQQVQGAAEPARERLLCLHHQAVDLLALELAAGGRCRLRVEAGIACTIEDLVSQLELDGDRRAVAQRCCCLLAYGRKLPLGLRHALVSADLHMEATSRAGRSHLRRPAGLAVGAIAERLRGDRCIGTCAPGAEPRR